MVLDFYLPGDRFDGVGPIHPVTSVDRWVPLRYTLPPWSLSSESGLTNDRHGLDVY